MKPVDPLLTAREVANTLRISLPTLYRRIADKTLPAPVKLGSLSRWPRSEILAALKAAQERRVA